MQRSRICRRSFLFHIFCSLIFGSLIFGMLVFDSLKDLFDMLVDLFEFFGLGDFLGVDMSAVGHFLIRTQLFPLGHNNI